MPGSWGSRIAIGISAAVGLYAVLLGSFLTPPIQRFALYAHYINSEFYHDTNDPEQFGFGKGQVSPFAIRTPDGETLYAWHVLPLDAYVRNEEALRAQSSTKGPGEAYKDSLAFRLLSQQQQAGERLRVVINFHGNAGHVGQGWRTDTYRNLATQANTHVITVDYRGFGKSTGSPTEAGLIADGVATVKWVLEVAKVRPEQIVILGQSLGTAVASATALHFADPQSNLLPASAGVTTDTRASPTVFAGVVLAAPFWSLPILLRTYRIGGFLPPVLLPLHYPQRLYDLATAKLADTWRSGERLAAYYGALHGSRQLHSGYSDPEGGFSDVRELGSLQLVHAVNDADIWYHHTRMICASVLGDERCNEMQVGDVFSVKEDGKPRVRAEILGHGGHNRIVTYAPVSAAVFRAFEGQPH